MLLPLLVLVGVVRTEGGCIVKGSEQPFRVELHLGVGDTGLMLIKSTPAPPV